MLSGTERDDDNDVLLYITGIRLQPGILSEEHDLVIQICLPWIALSD